MTEGETVKIQVETEVSKEDLEEWTTFVTGGKEGYADLFRTDHCGYWLRGIDHIASRGWLAYEHEDEYDAKLEEKWRWWFQNRTSRNRQPNHERVFVLDREIALKAFAVGVAKYGKEWYAEGDANVYDAVVQLTLLGEVRYG